MGHVCDTGWFDRTICPEPCGSMHSYCDICGTRQDPCAHDCTCPSDAEIDAAIDAATHQLKDRP